MGKSTQELKYKRLKVGHACYICRSKKIKCDGLRPCMQCKARGRNCQSSSNPGSTQSEQSITVPTTGSSDEQEDSSNSSNFDSDDDSILFARAKRQDDEDSKPIPYNESWTSSAIHTVSENFKQDGYDAASPFTVHPTFGSFVRWRDEPPLPAKYTFPIEMPSNEIQMHLIDLYFKSRYKITPMIPKRLFYEQLRIKGPIITPLLLNAMYCVVSNYSTLPDIPKPSVFYDRAKRLLDDFLDTPRVTTVAALCLLSLYEPLPTKTKRIADQHCRSWMYSGMAFRMCLELGLNVDTPSSHADMSLDGIEFCRRVFWSCYCLDKMQSSEWERLWSIPSSLVRTKFPQMIPGDDEEEQYIVKAYAQKIRLALIGEEGLQIRASFAIRNDILDSKFHDQLEYYRHQILKWRDDLDNPEMWGLAPCHSVEQVLNEPKQPSVISYLHIVFYFMLTETLFCLPDTYNNNDLSLEQRICASQLTKSVEIICDNPSMVIRYEFLAHITISAIRVHARYINHPDTVIAQQSYGFFNRCIQILRKFQKFAIIPECSAVLTHLPIICTNLDGQSTTGNPPNFIQVPSQQQYDITSNKTPIVQQQQLYNGLVDPYRTDTSSITSTAGYQNMGAWNMASQYNSLAAFGSTFGVDFADRRQLWEFALEDVNNNFQSDANSSGNSPINTSQNITQQQQNYPGKSEWNSPMNSDYTWPVASSQQEQRFTPPSRPLSYESSNATSIQQIQQQQQWSVSPVSSSPPSPQHYIQSHNPLQYSIPPSTSTDMNTILPYSSTHNNTPFIIAPQQHPSMNPTYSLPTQPNTQCYPCFPN